ncbi:aminotransferase class I/II-fold pyridoxal phosphate-dependent enzyme [Fluviispira multicolorata]|uniref:Aminotransferase class I/II-fold pyridoxal phosphate-dependent enzyme n=1 Tax=Fluviispira multicolorata TaxID=2654512 RepID=A0A833N3R1_9BACT|nr:aminotransferase class I/II-fold pyridoxal phosphate-dependent enzyme [Fluviispira multicolorata]KAB8030649.1 aminotransferase class I/II-fold pyridoxal phosphate-dependent enzyme [Fluviispira multicolorata]
MQQKSNNDNWQKKKIINSKSHQKIAFKTINDSIVIKREKGRKIYLENGEILKDFGSCSYFGLDLDERVIKASQNDLEQLGVNFAIARTRLRVKSFILLEDLLSEIYCQSHVTLFSSLHITHLGFIPLLSSGEMPSFPVKENGVYFIVDKTAHASIQINRGLMEQLGTVTIIDFQDSNCLRDAFQFGFKNGMTSISFSDSIGSMGGIAPLNLLIQLAEEYNGYVYLDDAHGSSVYGKNGCGYVLDKLKNKFHDRLILACSLSKGFGANAAALALPTQDDKETLKHFCTPYLFSNPPALSIVNAAIRSAQIHLSNELSELQNKLWENVSYFDSLLEADYIINRKNRIPIRGVFIGNEENAIYLTKILREKGFFVLTAMYPTVSKGKSILRLAIASDHKKEDIYLICQLIKEFKSI